MMAFSFRCLTTCLLLSSSLASVLRLPLEIRHPSVLCHVPIGKPAKHFRVVLDTGSQELWVFGESIRGSMPVTDFDHTYDDGTSTSRKKYKAKWWGKQKKELTLTYSDGDFFTGKMVADTIQVNDGKLKRTPITIVHSMGNNGKGGHPASKTVAHATNQDGVIGLSPFVTKHARAGKRPTPFFLQLLETEKLDEGIISIYLPDTWEERGEVTLGGINRLLFIGNMKHFPVRRNDDGEYEHWDLTLDSAHLDVVVGSGGRRKKNQGRDKHKDVPKFGHQAVAAIDSGSSHIFVSKDFFDYIVASSGARVNKFNDVVMDCGDRKKLNDLVFTFGGEEFRLTGEDYFSRVEGQDVDTCFLLVMDNVGSTEWLLGQPFLRKYYSVFNADEKTIGFAEAKHDASLTSTPVGVSRMRQANQTVFT